MATQMKDTPEEYAERYAQAQQAETRRRQAAAEPMQGEGAAEQPQAAQAPSRSNGPEIGFLPAGGIERAFIAMIYFGMFVLVLLSLFGSFYGLRGMQARISPPWQMALDAAENPGALGAALIVQIALTLAQYGARVRSQRDRRWWVGYLVVLGISLYYNVQAYWLPLTALGSPVLLTGFIIILADVLPEFVAVKH